MLSLCLVWCTFVALCDHFSSATTLWWSFNWSLERSLTVISQKFSLGDPFKNCSRNFDLSINMAVVNGVLELYRHEEIL